MMSDPKKSTTNSQANSNEIVKALFFKFESMFGSLWLAQHTTEDGWKRAAIEWGNSLSDVKLETLKTVVNHLRLSGQKYPPNLPEFLQLCKILSGSLIYEEKLKTIEHHRPWTNEERQNVREIIKKAKSGSPVKETKTHIEHPAWDKSRIAIRGKKFDIEYYNQRRDYLINLDEYQVHTLCIDDMYDRARYLKEEIAKKLYPHLTNASTDSEINSPLHEKYNKKIFERY